jgi:mannose-6-phosphate isomerase-like protein (cupin superfamily)
VAFTLEGTATITVGGDTREVNAGSIVVIAANTPHRFVNSGAGVLRQIDIHASPKFVQTNLRDIRLPRRSTARMKFEFHSGLRLY